jgi:peptidoglycan/LPS O-acetylase OafA/YrhL
MTPLRDADHRSIGLDVIRSIAIILVLISHYTNNMSFWLHIQPSQRIFFSGDLGVELFFALSGFLIGRILLDLAARAPTWPNLLIFLLRRWMRTLPLYWLCLAVLALAFPPAAHLGHSLLHFASLTQNLTQPMPKDDWFAVSWSLTIEEWFYLLFGAGVILSARLIRKPWAFWVPLTLLLTVPPALRLSVPAFADWSSGFAKMVPFRLDEIGYGVVLAWLHARSHWIFRHTLLPLSLGIGLIAMTWFDWVPLPFRLYWALHYNAMILGCVLCLPAALRVRNLPRWLESVVRTVSRQSYALYLIHLTILVDVAQSLWWTHRISTGTAILLALALPFPVAGLLSRIIEQPIMRLRPAQRFQPSARPLSYGWAAGAAPTPVATPSTSLAP